MTPHLNSNSLPAPTSSSAKKLAKQVGGEFKKIKAADKAKAPAKLSSDFISKTAMQTKMMTKAKTFARLDDVIEKGLQDDFEKGALLDRIRDGIKHDNLTWLEGYPTFTALVEGRFGFTYRTAKYLMNNFKYIAKHGIAPETLAGVGWTKVKLLVEGKKLTKGNAAELGKTAKKLSFTKLKAKVKGEAEKIIDPVTTPMVKKTAQGVGFLAGTEIPYSIADTLTPQYAAFKTEKELRDEMAALRDKLKAAFPTGETAPMAWLDAFADGWPDWIVKVEPPMEKFPQSKEKS